MKKTDHSKKDANVDRFWVVFTNPECQDKDGDYEPQGYAEISIELVPESVCLETECGLGRDAPN